MSQENIDIVVKSGGTVRVVRDLTNIADAADSADKRVKALQKTLDALGSAALSSRLRVIQGQLAGLGGGSQLTGFLNQLQQVTTALGQMNQQLAQAQQRLTQMGSGSVMSSLNGLRGMLASLATYLSVQKIMEWTDAWTEAAGKIRVFARDQAEANEVMERIFQIAQNVRAPLTNIASLYHRLTISGQELGASQNQMLNFTELVGKALAVQGTSVTQARGMLLQLSQAMGSVRIRGQEFNSIMENGPLILKIVAQNLEGMGGSVAKLRQRMLDGKLMSKEFFDAFLKGAPGLEKMFAVAPKTFGQAFIVLTNAVEKYLGKINEAYGISDKFYQLAVLIGNNLSTIASGLMIAGTAAAFMFGPAVLGAAGTALLAVWATLGRITAVLLTNPFALLAVAAVAAYQFRDSIKLGNDEVTTMGDLFSVVLPAIGEGFTTLGTTISNMWIGTLELFGQSIDGLTDMFGTATSNWTGAYREFYADVGSGFAGVVKALTKTADAIGGLILGLGIGLIRALEGIPNAVDQIGARMRNFFIGHIESMVNGVIEGVNKLRSLVGKDGLAPIQMARAEVDAKYFEKYGASIMGSIDAGFDMQGMYLTKKVEGLFASAAEAGKKRLASASASGASHLNDILGGGQAGAGGSRKELNAAAKNAQATIREMVDLYRVGAQEQAEIERHKEVMLKQQYDLGLINYAAYNGQLEAMQNASFEKRRADFDALRGQLSQKLETLPKTLGAAGASQEEIGNVLTDLRTKIRDLDNDFEKLKNHNFERLGANLVKALGPATEIVRNAELELTTQQSNLDIELQKLAAKTNVSQVTEREQFIQEEILRLGKAQVDTVVKYKAVMDQLTKNGAFSDMTDPSVLASWMKLNDAIQTAQAAVGDTAAKVREAAGQAFDAKQIEDFSKSLNTQITDAIVDGGKTGWEFIRDIFKKPLKMVINAVLNPITNAISGVFNGMMNSGMTALGIGGGGGGASAGGMMGSAINSMGGQALMSAGKWVMGGMGMGGAAAATAGGLSATVGAGTSIIGATSGGLGMSLGGSGLGLSASTAGATGYGLTAGSAAAGAGAAGGLAAGLAAIPVWGWAALAVMALIGGGAFKGGETRSGGQYLGTKYLEGPSGGQINADGSRQAITGTIDSINSSLKLLGSTQIVKALESGLESSKNGKGFAYAGGTLSGGATFGQSEQKYGIQNRRGSKTESQAFAEFAEELKQATMQALVAADVKGKLGNYLRSLGDIDSLLGESLVKAYDKVQASMLQRADLQAKIDELTTSASEKLTKARTAERAAIDDTNAELLEELYARADLVSAKNDLVNAYQIEGDAMDRYAQQIRNYASALWLSDKSTMSGSGLMQEAKNQFYDTVNKANAGDSNAREVLTSKADAYLSAALDSATSKSQYDSIFVSVQQALGGSASSAETTANTQLDQLKALGLINDTLMTWSAAWDRYMVAQAKVDTAVAAVAAANSSYVAAATPMPKPVAVVNELIGLLIGDDGGGAPGGDGSYAIGTNYVPYDMMARIHQGERIVPKWDNPYANPYTADSGNMDIRPVVWALEDIADILQARMFDLLVPTLRMRDIFEDWQQNGMPATRTA